MKFLSTFVLLAILSAFVEAATLHHGHARRSNHNRVLRRADSNTGRCRQRGVNGSGPANYNIQPDASSNSVSSTATPQPTETPQPQNSGSNTSPANTGGLIAVQDDTCGPNGATQQVTQTTGPNGSIDWLNCGIDGSGWTPPFIKPTDLVAVDLDDAIAQGGPFNGACEQFVWAFKAFGDQYGLPPILLASIANQESSCEPKTVGPNGEQGLMQITPEKCDGAPGGDCQDVGFNVMAGARFFADKLAGSGGSFLMALGPYNGWSEGLTVAQATAARYSNCGQQNNLDYLHQTVNGWMQNKDARAMHLGKYFNIADC